MQIMKKLLPLLTAASLALTGCTLPGERQKYADEDFIPDMDYADAEIITGNEIINYTWFLEPTISAENIIVFDGSQVDTSRLDLNTMYRDLAVVCQNGLYGFIDYNGSVLIKPKYKYYFVDPGGQIVLYNITNAKKNTREYCTMDREGHVTADYTPRAGSRIKYYYDEENKKVYVSKEENEWAVTEYTDKKAVVAQKASVYQSYDRIELVEPEEGQGGYGLIADGDILLDFEYDDYYAPAYKTTAIALKKGDKWGYFNAKGEKLIDFKCDGFFSSYNGELCDDIDSGHPYLYSNDILAVSVGSSFGYYTLQGGCLVKTSEFAQARPVHHMKSWVCKDGYWGIISFGEDNEEPVTTTTTTTATTTQWTQGWTTASSEDEEEEEEYWYPDEDDFYDYDASSEDEYNPGGEVVDFGDSSEDTPATSSEPAGEVPVDPQPQDPEGPPVVEF